MGIFDVLAALQTTNHPEQPISGLYMQVFIL